MSKSGATVRYPTFDIKLITEVNDYHITYDTRNEFSNDFVGESVISLTTKNAMEDDSAVFSFVLAGDVYWDRVLTSNDAIILKINPNEGDGNPPSNPVILVGLVSEVRLEGDYGENSKMYRITGQSFAKAFINFELGVIQEVSVVLTEIGWLPNSTENGGVAMTNKNASELVEAMINRFIDYMEYNFNGQSIKDFLTWNLDSWINEEKLVDEIPFINYEGSLKQLLDDVTAKPFNELFFDATADEKCQLIMRRTPFDKADWTNLESYYVTSDQVISESVAVSDTEAYSVFNIANNISLLESTDLGSYPQYYDSLVKRYGYKKLEVENIYLARAWLGDNAVASAVGTITESTGVGEEILDGASPSSENSGSGDSLLTNAEKANKAYNKVTTLLLTYRKDDVRKYKDKIISAIVSYDKRISRVKAGKLVTSFLKNGIFNYKKFLEITGLPEDSTDPSEGGDGGAISNNYQALRSFLNANHNPVASELADMIVERFPMTTNQAMSIAQTYLANNYKISRDQYEEIMGLSGEEGAVTDNRIDGDTLKEFTKRIANWYCENPNFYSGDITVKGSPDYRLGAKMFLEDKQNSEFWEYYIESVQHDYSYSNGYTTTLGVTRGLQNLGKERFTNLWGKSEDFKGGLLGEMSMQELLDLQESLSEDDDDSSSPSSDTSGSGKQLAVFPIDRIQITQGENGSYSHMGTLCLDLVGTTAKYPYYAPCDCEMVERFDDSAVAIWKSSRPVRRADGSEGDIFWSAIHELPITHTKGTKLKKGDLMGHTGSGGHVTGDHLHLQVMDGSNYQGFTRNSQGANTLVGKELHAYDVFSIYDNVKKKEIPIINGYAYPHYSWKSVKDWSDEEEVPNVDIGNVPTKYQNPYPNLTTKTLKPIGVMKHALLVE